MCPNVFYIICKNIKKISKRDIACWIFLTLFLIELFIEAFLIPKYHVLNPIYEKSLVIERIYFDNHHHKRMILHADGEEYYMSYSSLYASESIRKIRKDLENGTLAVGDTVTIQFISADDIRFNFILQKKRIVDLRTENEIYYTLDTEKTILTEHKIGAIILFFVFLLVWSLFTYLSLITDNILIFRQSKKRKTHKKYKKSK